MINKFSPKQLDNFHIVLWLMKDIFWVREEQFWGVLMIMPTVGVAMILTIQSIRQKQGFYSNFAILCWMVADSTWMADEFFVLNIEWLTLGLFALGIASMIYYYVVICNIFKINFVSRIRFLKFES
ncbi:MAG: hypothetical protein EAZ53_08780 [Bacteroidetes bacterium]|nr:MAG: hypothetical protein EAZ53_08780 [Bacteroidota bacterium]